jgi:CDP-paratose 2-epimerase
MADHILITGGAGFVGSSLALYLRSLSTTTQITALDNLKRRGSEFNVARLKAAGISFVHGDVRSREDVFSLGRPDVILECSAEPSVLAGYGGSPEYLINTNLIGCYNCLELARTHQSTFIFISTSRVYPYGPLNALPFEETPTRYRLSTEQTLAGVGERGISERFPLDGARSLYGMTKLAAELMVAEYGAAYGIPTIINRCGLISGPWQMGKTDQGVIVLWLAAHYLKKSLRYIGFAGTGKQVRDVLAIEDLCALIADQLGYPEAYDGGCFNVGGGLTSSVSLFELTELCRQVTGFTVPVEADGSDRPADIRLYVSDTTAIEQVRGWKPRQTPVTILQGIEGWLRQNESLLRPILEENFPKA